MHYATCNINIQQRIYFVNSVVQLFLTFFYLLVAPCKKQWYNLHNVI
nr:MAG TPA: hypothetical protein [Caudoviricetes sp.]